MLDRLIKKYMTSYQKLTDLQLLTESKWHKMQDEKSLEFKKKKKRHLTGPNDLLLIILFKVQEVRLFDSGSQLKEQSQSLDSSDARSFTFNKVTFQEKECPSEEDWFRFYFASKLEILFTNPSLVSFYLILKKT